LYFTKKGGGLDLSAAKNSTATSPSGIASAIDCSFADAFKEFVSVSTGLSTEDTVAGTMERASRDLNKD
jgi:hypothetical protein